jgi:hypothetical protein
MPMPNSPVRFRNGEQPRPHPASPPPRQRQCQRRGAPRAPAAGIGAAAPQPAPLATPGALASYNNFVGTTAPLTLGGGFYTIDFTAVSANGDLFVEAQDGKGVWSSIRSLNVLHTTNFSGLTLASPSTVIRFNNQSPAVATVSISLTGP